jgi:hypothetical protein
MRHALAALGLIGALRGLPGCHKPAADLQQDARALDAGHDVATSLEGGDAAPRCEVTRTSSFGDAEEGQDLDVGDGPLLPGGAFVGLLRTVRGSRLASVARIPQSGAQARVMDLGQVSGAVSPPTLFARDDDVFAVGRVLPALAREAGDSVIPGDSRGATLFHVADASPATGMVTSAQAPEPLLTLPPMGTDASAIAAVAAPMGSPLGAILAWDEDAPRPVSRSSDPQAGVGIDIRGVIRVALVGPNMRTLMRVDLVSPGATDAERPRVALREGGFWVAWIARKIEPEKDAASEIEGPGQEQAYRWVELLALDVQGKPVGPVRRLTAATGHASGFVMDTDPRGSRLDLYVGLDEERSDGTGGGIVRVTLGPEGPPRVTPMLSEGVARGSAPWLVRAAMGEWLLYVDVVDAADHTRALLLDNEGQITGLPSLEPNLDDARPIAASPMRGASASSGGEVLALTQAPPGPLRWLSCIRSR